MAIETEIKLSLPPRAAAQLAAHPLLAGIKPLRQKLLNTYYDTPDLQLQCDRIAVRYRKKGWQWLLTVKRSAPSAGGLVRRNEWEAPGLPGEFDFSHVDDKKLRHRLEALRHELTPAFTTDFTRNAWLYEPQPGVRIELALDRGRIEALGKNEAICELELELLDGDVDALFSTARELQATLHLHPEAASKAERGYRLFTAAPRKPARAPPIEIDDSMSSLCIFRIVALSCLGHLQDNERGLHENGDPEFVHQARVAIRRLRSAIRAWKPLLPSDFVTRFDPHWKTLARQFGDTRNWDVFCEETLPQLTESFPGNTQISQLARHAVRCAAKSRKDARAALKTINYSQLLLEFTREVLALPESATPQLKTFVQRCLSKRAKRVLKLAKNSQGADTIARHRLRVAAKRLRYALEFFSQLYPGPRLQSYHQAVTHLQDRLGRMNDLVIATHIIGEALPGNDLVSNWLSRRNERLQPKTIDSLNAFLKQKTPWKHP